MKNLILIAMLGAMVSACQTAATAPTMPDQQAIELARQSVIAAMKDPDSAKFGPTFERKNYYGIDIVCGTVNGKNSFGAFTGSKRFVFKVSERQVIIDGNDPDPLYRNAATIFCG